MSKAPSPLLGYNNNVRHKNRVFHIQTEDSGVKHPHIITHLFMDGGRILKSIKRSYAEHVGADNMSDTVRAMMKEQHKSMLIALRDGQFDHLLEGGESKSDMAKVDPKAAAKAEAKPAEAKAEVRAPSVKPPSVKPPSVKPPSVKPPSVRPASIRPDAKPPSVRPELKVPKTEPLLESPAASAGARRVTQGMIPAQPQARASGPVSRPEDAPMTTRQEQPPSGVVVDVDALERSTNQPQGGPGFPNNDLPPPPKNMFKEKTAGTYRSLSGVPDAEAEARAKRTPPQPPGKPASTPPRSTRGQDLPPPPPRPPSRPAPAGSPKPPPASRPAGPLPARHPQPAPPPQAAASGGARAPGGGSDGRYAPARPAAIFGQARPHQGSIFGEDLISDKSLDEVILSYLAEDLEPPPKKR